MEGYQIALLAIAVVIIILLVVIIIRTLLFKPNKKVEITNETIDFDSDKIISNLQTLIKFKTVSNVNSSLEDENEFKGFVDVLPKLYPNVIKTCSLKKFNGRALLFKWEGKNHDKPSVMMSHYDVVPVNEELWSVPCFDGLIKDGVMYGRGVIDTKVTFNAVMSSVDKLISDGFIPNNDVYLAFSGGEEINGEGARNIVNYFEENNIVPNLVVDEGGGVVENVFPGVKTPCGVVGIAEKGMMIVEYVTNCNGGHASAPKPHTPIGKLSSACTKIENNPFKMKLTEPVKQMFDTLGRHSSFLYRMIFANLWAFGWVIDLLGKKQGGDINALLRTTVAFTQMEGSKAQNVIPAKAKMVSNIRLNPSDTVDSALAYLKRTVNDSDIEITTILGVNPSRISKTDCAGYAKVESAIANTWKGSIVSPYLMVQCSDSRHYGKISDKVYRFSACDLTKDERASIHGIDEHLRLSAIIKSVEFYLRLLKQC